MFYGIVLGRLGENDKAKEALTESLEIIDEFTKNSGDRPYLNNEEILTRIRACNYLVKMDSSTRWL